MKRFGLGTLVAAFAALGLDVGTRARCERPGASTSALRRRSLPGALGRQLDLRGHQLGAQAQGRRLHDPHGAEPALRAGHAGPLALLRRDPPGRRHPSAPRRVAEQRRGRTRARAIGYGAFYPFMATGEEKTIYELPKGYGYPVGAKDMWIFNYMIHNLWPQAALGVRHLRHRLRAHDHAAGQDDHTGAPDLDGRRGRSRSTPSSTSTATAGVNGQLHVPGHGQEPLRGRSRALNEFTIDHPGHADRHRRPRASRRPVRQLDMIRPGAAPTAARMPGHRARTRCACSAPTPTTGTSAGRSRGTWRWQGTATDWRPDGQGRRHPAVSATYETRTPPGMSRWGSWSCGRPGTGPGATDPFSHKLDQSGHLTHGHLAENDNHGGDCSTSASTPDNARTARRSQVDDHAASNYNPGDFTATGKIDCMPTVVRARRSRSSTRTPARSNISFLVPTADYQGRSSTR